MDAMKRLFVLFLFFCQPAYAQPKAGKALIDSLINEINSDSHKGKEDAVNVVILRRISGAYYDVDDPQKGIEYGKQALSLAEKLGLKNELGPANNELGNNYCAKGDYPAAFECWLKALKIYEETGHKKDASFVLENIGRIFVVQGNLKDALGYYDKALAISEEIRDSAEIPHILGAIGGAYDAQKDFPKALEYYNKALEKHRKNNDKDEIANTIGNIGGVYGEQNDYIHALESLFLALRLNEELQDKMSILINLGNIGECYLNIAKDSTGRIYNDVLIPKGSNANLQKAIEYLDKSIALSKETANLSLLESLTKDLSEAEELSGNYKTALENYKLFVTVKDSVFNIDNNVKITNLETKRELALKDKQIEIDKIKKQNERVYYLSGIIVLFFIVGFAFRANKRLGKEKRRSDDLLLNILPAEVADELKNTGGAVAKNFDNVTVLFTDFVNFTKASEMMSPEQLIDELHTCFKTFDDITAKYNIEKIKTIGDAYLAVAGLPMADAKHAEHVVCAAIEINEFIAARRRQLGDKTFEIRIGVHSGSVVAGIVGIKKFAYDIWGDTVNTAARMQQTSDPGKINISQTTYDMVNSKFMCVYRGEIDAKNKGMMKMYFVE
jgi:class 3 adenylate cyclase/tetratricopeptide (TPR) repeat protein